MRLVTIVEPLRHQDFDRLTDELHFVITEHVLPARIELANHPVAVRRNNSSTDDSK